MTTTWNVPGLGAETLFCPLRKALAIAIASAIPVSAITASEQVVEEVIVTGTLLKGTDQRDTAISVEAVSGLDMENSGISSLTEAISTLTAQGGSEFQVDTLGSNNTSGTAAANLRNLGLGSTLVLVDGQRTAAASIAAPDGSMFVDTNSLMPQIMVSRMEVLKTGASSIYGSDAVAGVINVIPKKNFDGADLKFSFADMSNSSADGRTLEGIWGRAIGSGHVVASASIFDSTRMEAGDREWSLASTYGYPAWQAVSSSGFPGSFTPVSGGAAVADPDCLSFEGSYKNSPNDICRFDYSPFYELYPEEQRYQGYLLHSIDLESGVSLQTDFSYSKTKTETIASPSFPFLSSKPVVPGSHPDNIFNEDVYFSGRIYGAANGPSTADFSHENIRVTNKMELDIETDLLGMLGMTNVLSYSQQKSSYDRPDTIFSRVQAALNGFGGAACDASTGTAGVGDCMYFNPFGSSRTGAGSPNDPSLMSWLNSSTDLKATSKLFLWENVMTADLAETRYGQIRGALGAAYRWESLDHDWGEDYNNELFLTLGTAPDAKASRSISSVFTEIEVPVYEDVLLTAAARYENYDKWDNISPKLALLWTPLDNISLRSSFSRAFRAPSLFQMGFTQASQPYFTNPWTGQAFQFTNVQTVGNENLDPETADIFDIGISFEPVDQLTVNLDYWSFDYTDMIVKESAEGVAIRAEAGDQEAMSRVRLGPSNDIELITTRFINANKVKTDGVDLGINYQDSAGAGNYFIDLRATRVLSYDIELNGEKIDGLGKQNVSNFARTMPELQWNLTFDYSVGNHGMAVLTKYIDGFKNDRTYFEHDVDAMTVVDLKYRYDASDLLGADSESSLRFSFGIDNVSDEKPPLVENLLAFDPSIHNPLGRVYYAELHYSL